MHVALDYNIAEYMKKYHANISLFELTRIASQRKLLVYTLAQPASSNSTYLQKGSGKSFGPPEFVVNALTLDANTLFTLFLLTFKKIYYNVHKFLVDYGLFINLIPLYVANKIDTKWHEIDAQIIQANKTLFHAIGELRTVLIRLSFDQ